MRVCVRVREKLPCCHSRAGLGSPLTARLCHITIQSKLKRASREGSQLHLTNQLRK